MPTIGHADEEVYERRRVCRSILRSYLQSERAEEETSCDELKAECHCVARLVSASEASYSYTDTYGGGASDETRYETRSIRARSAGDATRRVARESRDRPPHGTRSF